MWKNKPALFAAFIMAGGFAAARMLPVPPALWMAAALALAAIGGAVLFRARRHASPPMLSSISIPLLLFAASGLWYAASVGFGPDHLVSLLHIGRPLRITADIVEEPVVRDGRMQFVIDVVSAAAEQDSVSVEGKALLTVAHARSPFAYGDRIALTAVFEEPQDVRNPGEVSYRDYLALNNVFAVLRVKDASAITVIGKGEASWLYASLVLPARHFAAGTIASVAKGDERHYLTGLLLGDRSDISKEIRKAFANTGTVHVLAVSGSHVVVIVAALYALFGIMRIPLRPKIVATIIAVLFYMLLTGAAPSVVRASFMTCVVLAGKLVQRRASVYNCLGVSAILMFLYDPRQVFDVGFQLSFVAVLSMVFCYPRMAVLYERIPKASRWGRVASAAAALTAVSAAAQIGTIPFTALYFEKVSMISLAANLVIVPLAGLNITLGVAGILVSLVSFWVGSCFTEVNCLLARLVLASVKASDLVPFAVIHTPSFGIEETVLYMLSAGLLFAVPHPRMFKKLFLVLFFAVDCLLLASAAAPRTDPLRVTFFDVGQGDAALLEFPGGTAMMIDAGGRTALFDAGEKIVAPGLRRRGVTRLSSVLITHAHDDHAGGLETMCGEIHADRIITSALVPQAGITGAERLPHPFAAVKMGDTIGVCSAVRLYVLGPARVDRTDSSDAEQAVNNSSAVVRLCYGRVAFLFMGDADNAVERELADRYGDFLSADVIKIGHHGSRTSTSEELLRAAHPAEAVISVGRFNAFRHPSSATLRRLAAFGIRTHRTDREGAVIFETDGRELHRSLWRDEARRRGIVH